MGFGSTSNTTGDKNTTYTPLDAICCHQLLSSPCKLRGLRQVGLFLLLLGEALVELSTWEVAPQEAQGTVAARRSSPLST